jgi:hypothetical protein
MRWELPSGTTATILEIQICVCRGGYTFYSHHEQRNEGGDEFSEGWRVIGEEDRRECRDGYLIEGEIGGESDCWWEE